MSYGFTCNWFVRSTLAVLFLLLAVKNTIFPEAPLRLIVFLDSQRLFIIPFLLFWSSWIAPSPDMWLRNAPPFQWSSFWSRIWRKIWRNLMRWEMLRQKDQLTQETSTFFRKGWIGVVMNSTLQSFFGGTKGRCCEDFEYFYNPWSERYLLMKPKFQIVLLNQ